jgi:hypothetical protein
MASDSRRNLSLGVLSDLEFMDLPRTTPTPYGRVPLVRAARTKN